MITAIDPGPKYSAYVMWDEESETISFHEIVTNNELLDFIRTLMPYQTVVCEMIQSFGMPVGREIFETVLLIGQFKEIASYRDFNFRLVYRKEIKSHFCNTVRATDANIRQVLKDRFGDPGTKKNPGKLYGIKKDEWSALALAVYWADKQNNPTAIT